MGVKLLLDSVILIDHLNGIRVATEYLAKEHLNCSISVITRAEVLAGYDRGNQESIRRFLDSFPSLIIDGKTADLAACLRREHRWKLPDAFQAALSEIQQMKLVTRNTKDFPVSRFKFVIVPYAIKFDGLEPV